MRTRVIAGWRTGLSLSLIAATVLTLIQIVDLWVPSYQPRFGEVSEVSYRVPYGAVHEPKGKSAYYDSWHNFVPVGTKLNAHNPSHVAAVSYEVARRPPSGAHLLGVWAIFFTLSMALTSYLRKFAQNRLKLLRVQVGIFSLIAGLTLFSKLLLLYSQVSEFWIPVAVVPLWVATSFDRRTALVATVVTSFIVASLLRFDLLVLTVMLAQGMSAILLFLDRRHSRALLLSGTLAGASAAGMLLAMMFMLEGRFEVLTDLESLSGSRLLGCLGGGVLAGGIAALVRSPAERALGHVPREQLHDLTDLEQPLLKHMAEHAPGSWEHSRAMANLAEQAASAIGADALLVRVGAYYHDLGKSVRPKFFVENLTPKEQSPHDALEPHESAEIIRQHVVEGAKILRDGGIPEPVVEFSYTHHGKQTIEYFWNKCKQAGNTENLTEEDFRYPGMQPQTKETAILMLVDSIEAASRTIDPPNRAQFEIMIQRIVFSKLQQGMLDHSGLNMRDLNTIVSRMADTLVNMHHHRIKYPWQARQAEQFGVPSRAVSDAPTAPSGRSLTVNRESSPPPAAAPAELANLGPAQPQSEQAESEPQQTGAGVTATSGDRGAEPTATSAQSSEAQSSEAQSSEAQSSEAQSSEAQSSEAQSSQVQSPDAANVRQIRPQPTLAVQADQTPVSGTPLRREVGSDEHSRAPIGGGSRQDAQAGGPQQRESGPPAARAESPAATTGRLVAGGDSAESDPDAGPQSATFSAKVRS